MLKLWLRRAHLFLTLISGLFLLILSLSGSFLIYAKDIQHFIQPEKWLVSAQGQVLDHGQLINHVEQQTQQKIVRYMPEEDTSLAWQFSLANKRYVNVDPYTGNIIHNYEYYKTLYGFTLGLHRWLLYENSEGKKILRNWVSTCALLLIINVLVGFYIWVKPKNRIKRLAIKPKAKIRVLLYQLHTVLGVYFFIPLLLIAFTGMTFNWKGPTQSVVEFVTFNKVESRPKDPKINRGNNVTPQLSLAIANGLNAFTDAQLYRVYMPKTDQDPLRLRVKNPGEVMAYSWVSVNPYTAEVISTYDASKANFSTQVWNFKYKFHTGSFAGPVVQFLWLLIVLSLSFFVISGFYFWFKRHKWI
ncbi:PepSY domain-containing protein [Pseudoalteromonas sp. MMG010]|uniref:PepSY-associated TM helix domain-containing protein n=1 Tax=Pseudoalteromonas sp. MMG010 TaxID=2822685 RepID=UPI001B3A4A03|nr:PepSY-associated TM helix domain-containing protein [Pseudoalteromonas sp. MMG010]MBQ4833750.1 PepSY domain-containing protein [Pseudoalteromonas sp. MMG010]